MVGYPIEGEGWLGTPWRERGGWVSHGGRGVDGYPIEGEGWLGMCEDRCISTDRPNCIIQENVYESSV